MHVISAEPVIWRLSFQLSRHSCQGRRPFLLHIWIQKSAPVYLSRSEALVLTSFLRASSWSRTSKRLWLQIPVRWVYVAMSRQCRRLYGHYRFFMYLADWEPFSSPMYDYYKIRFVKTSVKSHPKNNTYAYYYLAENIRKQFLVFKTASGLIFSHLYEIITSKSQHFTSFQ